MIFVKGKMDEEEKIVEKKIKNQKKVSKDDVVEINLNFLKGLGLENIRKNPWILTTIVLGVVLLISLFSGGSSLGGVSSDKAAGNLLDFINSQSSGQLIDLVGVSKKSGLYEVIISADGQSVPVYVTLDGELAFLASDGIPIAGSVGDSGTVGTGNLEDSGIKRISSVNLGDSPFIGEDNAPVTIVEFSDFECPFCGKFFAETLPLIKSEYVKTGKVKLVYRHFPLTSIHPLALPAAEAAECVNEQKGDAGFFEYHDKIFDNQALLSNDNLKKWAYELNVDKTKFDECFNTKKYETKILQETSYGSSLGISGTPGFFIGNEENGYTFISGALPFSVFQQAI